MTSVIEELSAKLNEESLVISEDPVPSEKNEETKELDEFSYLKTGGFSSELYKIEIKNMPKFYGISELKKLLNNKLQLKTGKIKPPRRGSSWLYVCFHNEADRLKAIQTLDGYKWKGSDLKAVIANPAPDPLVRKRKAEAEEEDDASKIKKVAKSQEEQIKDSTIPYWNVPYEKQIEYKHRSVRGVILKLGNELWKTHSNIRGYIEAQRNANDGLICSFSPIKTAETIDGYRNKCEFTVGMDSETKLPTVGFRISSYVKGVTGVAPVEGLNHISKSMKKAVLVFQEYVRSSPLKTYSPEDHSGHWSQVMIRESANSGDLMLVIGVIPQQLSEEEIELLKKSLVDHFTSNIDRQGTIKSIYFQNMPERRRDASAKLELIWGESHIFDSILGLQFRISPASFFQINTAGANKLYETAIELAQPTQTSTVLDICCGTGTIGLCFAKHCGQVLGLELIPEAISDAKVNAVTNNITNSDFFAGRAEDILTAVVGRVIHQDVIAIVDPPRAGLHMRAITQLRRMKQIKRLVYLSCDPSAAMKNFLDLGRASSKTMHGDPFVCTRAVGVDMFPYTKHTELVLLFERMAEEDLEKFNTTEKIDVIPPSTAEEIKADEVKEENKEVNENKEVGEEVDEKKDVDVKEEVDVKGDVDMKDDVDVKEEANVNKEVDVKEDITDKV